MPPSTHRQSRHARPHPVAQPSPSSFIGRKIMWLPKREELNSDLGIERGCYNHPVVILSPFVEDGKVVVLIITSLDGRALKDCRWTQAVRDAHLPISPCDAHPDNGKLLYLEHGRELKKKSYVKTHNKLTLPLGSLREVDAQAGPVYFFTAASYKEILEAARFTPPPLRPDFRRQGHLGTGYDLESYEAAYPDTVISTERLINGASARPPIQNLRPNTYDEDRRPVLSHSERGRYQPVYTNYSDRESLLTLNAAAGARRDYGTTHPSSGGGHESLLIPNAAAGARRDYGTTHPSSRGDHESLLILNAATGARRDYGTTYSSSGVWNTTPCSRTSPRYQTFPAHNDNRDPDSGSGPTTLAAWCLCIGLLSVCGYLLYAVPGHHI